MQVTRETVNNAPHIITDYMYEGDNIGINLISLNEAKTYKKLNLDGVAIDYNPVSLNNVKNKIEIQTELKNIDDTIKMTSTITYPSEIIKNNTDISDEAFATDMINTCILEKKDIKNIPCYKQCIENMVNEIKATALDQNVLIKSDCWNYKAFVYSNSMELLGVANRILRSYNGNYILGEYVGKKLSEHMGKNIYIDLCINDEMTLQFANVKVENTIDSSLSYVLLDMQNCMIKRLTENYENITLNVPDGFIFPEFKVSLSINDYFEKMLTSNTPKNIEEYFKRNKPNTSTLININKYLIW